MKPLKEKTGITLDEEIVEKIKDLAEKEERSVSQCVNRILREHIEKMQELDSSSIRGENTAKDSMIAELMTIIRTQAETLLQQQNFINDHFMELHQKKISPPRVGVEYPYKEHIKE